VGDLVLILSEGHNQSTDFNPHPEVMMNNNSLLRLQVRIQQAWTDLRDSERGQTMVEYAGIGLVVVAIVAAVAAALSGDKDGGIGKAITGKISEVIGTIKGKK
jgi:hypothetical protein